MAWATEMPWHGLGTEVPADLNWEEFLRSAGLDWKVALHPSFTRVDGKEIVIPNRYALVRDSDYEVLTNASRHWNPLQNQQVLEFFQKYVDAGAVNLETAGSLNNGRVVWGLAKIGEPYQVRPGDITQGYLLFRSPHICGSAISLRVTTVRVVCANTMAMALNGKADYSQSHMSPFNFDLARAAVEAAHATLGEAHRRSVIIDGLKLTLEDAIKKVVVPVFAPDIAADEELMAHVMEPEAMPDSVMGILYSIVKAPGAIKDTGWGVLNGITHWCDHVAGNSQDSRLASNWGGDLGKKKIKAEQLLMELATDSEVEPIAA
jgi:phage/plasmid-like protein (TIGR03299 family)